MCDSLVSKITHTMERPFLKREKNVCPTTNYIEVSLFTAFIVSKSVVLLANLTYMTSVQPFVTSNII